MTDRIIQIINEIKEMPYGKEIHATHNTLPPSPFHYKKRVKELIDEVIVFWENGANITMSQIQELRSLLENDVENLITNRKSPLKEVFNGVDEEMERISNRIEGIIEGILSSKDNA